MFVVEDKIKMTMKWKESLDKLALLREKKKKKTGFMASWKGKLLQTGNFQSDALENYDLIVVTKC